MDASKTQKTSSTNWIPQLCIMRVAACIAIVVLHTVFAANEYFASEISIRQDIVSRIVENNMMWAVPIFLMVTGTLHLNHRKRLSLGKLYKKYILRIVIVLALFSLIFRLFDMIMDGETFSVGGLLKGFYEMITSTGWGHLWYLYLLIGIYVLMPFYKMISEASSNCELKYLLLVFIVFLSFIPLIESFGTNIGFYICEALIYPLYLFLGHMIHEKLLRGTKVMGGILLVVSIVAITLLTVLKYKTGVDVPSVLFGYQSPFVIIQSIGVFMVLDNCDFSIENERNRKLLVYADGMTFSIYLIHMLFVRLLFKYIQFNPYNVLAPVTLFLCIVGIFAITCILTAILKKVPGLGKLI